MDKLRVLLGRLIPVRGNTWWEVQVGPLVLFLRHRTPAIERAPLVHAMWDRAWLD